MDDETAVVLVEVLCNGRTEGRCKGSVEQAVAFLLARTVEGETDNES